MIPLVTSCPQLSQVLLNAKMFSQFLLIYAFKITASLLIATVISESKQNLDCFFLNYKLQTTYGRTKVVLSLESTHVLD